MTTTPSTPKRPRIEMSDEAKEAFQKKLGEEFGAVFHGLRNEWAGAKMRSDEYRELFRKPEDVRLLNAVCGGGFIWDVQHIFWNDLMLRLCRLTDPIGTARKKNLTVRKLPEFCEHQVLRPKVQKRVDCAVDAAKFARPWRNKRISHADLAKAITPSAEPLPPASLQQMTKALDSVHAVLNTISIKLLDTEIGNHVIVEPRARAFLCHIRQLVEAVQYIDSLVDPSGSVRVTDLGIARAFLQKFECRPTAEQAMRIIDLRESAHKYS